jgi:hypothetical protein
MTVEDAKMTDKENTSMETTEKDATNKAIEEDEAATKAVVVVVPPLQAAAQRLERLLGGSSTANAAAAPSTTTTTTTLLTARQQLQQQQAAEQLKLQAAQQNFHYTNPAKVVRRWLSTSSGAAGDATAADIQSAAAILLDPAVSSKGRSLLVTPETATPTASVPAAAAAADGETPPPPPPPVLLYVKMAAREVESWLISLAVRILWKEQKYAQAFELAQRGMDILLAHIEEASLKITTAISFSGASGGGAASLFPLLARLTRWRSLAAESLLAAVAANSRGSGSAASPDTLHAAANLRIDLARAHNLATLRRDVDTQATLLNSMLRDLLKHSQGMYIV